MPELSSLVILYTAHLCGDLALMARLYSFLEQLRLRHGTVLLLDLGEQCAGDVWHCAATDGRSALVVLDAMGYHAANVQGALAEGSRHRLLGTVTMALVDERRAWRYHVPPVQDEGIVASVQPSPALRLNIVLTPSEATRLEGRTLSLADVPGGCVGQVALALVPVPAIQHHAVLTMPTAMPPHPTISATVDFVQDEARVLR